MVSPEFDVRGHDDRGAEGASIDAPKALSGVRYGKGCPLPSRLQRVSQQGPAAMAFSACFRPQNASGSKKNTILLPKLESTRRNWYFLYKNTQIPLWKSGVNSHNRHIQSCTYGCVSKPSRELPKTAVSVPISTTVTTLVLRHVKTGRFFKNRTRKQFQTDENAHVSHVPCVFEQETFPFSNWVL